MRIHALLGKRFYHMRRGVSKIHKNERKRTKGEIFRENRAELQIGKSN